MTLSTRIGEIENVLAQSGLDGGQAQTGGDLLADVETHAAELLIECGALEQASEMLAGANTPRTNTAARAAAWLALARAWAARLDVAGHEARAEAAFRGAAAFAPAQAHAALAQFLVRHGRLAEAIVAWRDAVRLEAHESAHSLGLARAFEQAGQPLEALATYLSLIEAAPTARNYLTVAARLAVLSRTLPDVADDRIVNIALVGNATLDHLRSYVIVECYRAGLRPVVHQGGFDQYRREMLDPDSELYAFGPDVLICAIHASQLFPKLHSDPFDTTPDERRSEIETGLGSLQQLLDIYTSRNSGLVLLHNFASPQYPAAGIADLRDEMGQTFAFAQVNSRLAALARERYRNIYVVDEDRIQAQHGKAKATDPRLWLTARVPWSDGVLAGLAREYVRYVRAARGLNRKCVVLDLDNTLWGGVVGEDGLAGIRVGPEAPGNAFVAFQRELEKLWRRGILLAVCSKNNPGEALRVFEQHPDMVLRASHFAAVRINWQSKAQNIREIASELNIGLNSLVFLDDNPVERAQVRAELPEVLTPELPADPAEYRRCLLDLGVFDALSVTAEDRIRNRLYREQRARHELQAELAAGGATRVDEYLSQLDIVVDIEPANELNLPRIAQLTNKTNQFNMTTRRYTEADIVRQQADGWRAYAARVKDRVGDNGLTGVALIEPIGERVWEVDTLLLSCRVMGRGVEAALLGCIADDARQAGVEHLRAWFIPSERNAPAANCYREHGFSLLEQRPDGSQLWQFDVAEAVPLPGWLTVRTPAALAS